MKSYYNNKQHSQDVAKGDREEANDACDQRPLD